VSIGFTPANGIPPPENTGISELSTLSQRLNATSVRCSSLNEKAEAQVEARSKKRWSAQVTRHSNALDLESNIFTQRSPRRIALSLKRSAERSRRRKATPYQSAMSMLNFYINRGGSGISDRHKAILRRAKSELRKVFHRA
jgi:hypothetical protein